MYAIALKLLAAATSALGGWIPGLGSIGHALKVATYLIVLGGGAWGGVKAANWWHSGKITVAESDKRCVDAISLATLNAKIAAVDAREHTLRTREEQVASDEEAVKAAVTKMEKDRAETAAGGDGVLVRDGNEWLRRYRARYAAPAGRR